MKTPMNSERVLQIAQAWAGTPYRHQGSLKGVGCDCLGLIRGVWRELYGAEPEAIKPYEMDWAETGTADPLLDAAKRHFIGCDALQPGCLILFRWKVGTAAKHCGIYLGEDRFVHAYERHCVMASALIPHWRRRIAGLFLFPELMNGD
jgi:NlpC/P60 family putative phage cell wall peptidase